MAAHTDGEEDNWNHGAGGYKYQGSTLSSTMRKESVETNKIYILGVLKGLGQGAELLEDVVGPSYTESSRSSP